MKIKKNDQVRVIAGKDKGKAGKVLCVLPRTKKAIVEGINFIKKHARKTQQDQQGGIVQRESPIDISNLMVICARCNKPTRVGFTKLSDGTKTRYCKMCKEIV